MALSDSSNETGAPVENRGRTVYREILDTMVTGVAIIVPFVVTFYVLVVAMDFVIDVFEPFVGLLEWLGVIDFFTGISLVKLLLDLNVYWLLVGVVTEFIALTVLLGVVFLVGTVGRNHYGERAVGYVDDAVTAIPGVGTVYESFRRMGDVMLDDGAENFKEVTLVRWSEDIHVLGFVTNDAPVSVDGAIEQEDLVTVFVPFAPNPVTGGFLTYVPRDRLVAVDMTMQEGLQSILTSGVASDAENGTV